MRKKFSWGWFGVSGLALLGAAVLGTGFMMAVAGPSGQAPVNPPEQSQSVEAKPVTAEKQDKQEVVVALGDSLTKGVGDADGKGYVGYLKDRLEKEGRQVKMQNLGISGLESGELVKSVSNPGYQQLFKDANFILISIGGNDITHSLGGVDKVFGGKGIDEKAVLAAQSQYTKNVDLVLKSIREQNPKVPIYMLGLYNPFEGLLEDDKQANNLLLNWNDNLRKTAQAYSNVKIVPMFDIFQWNSSRLLSGDHFHPNTIGYDLMAERIFDVLPHAGQAKQ